MKVRCIKSYLFDDVFTVGETYELKEGSIEDNRGYVWGSGLETLDDLNDYHPLRGDFEFEEVEPEQQKTTGLFARIISYFRKAH